MGKKVEIGETMVRVITPEELDDASRNAAKKDSKRVVKCNRCEQVLFDGTVDTLVSMVTEWTELPEPPEDQIQYGHVEFECANDEFEDPRKPRPTTIVNEDGEEERVAVERLKGCYQRVTVSVEKLAS